MHSWKFIHRKQMSGAFCSKRKAEVEPDGGREGEKEAEVGVCAGRRVGAYRDSTNQ